MRVVGSAAPAAGKKKGKKQPQTKEECIKVLEVQLAEVRGGCKQQPKTPSAPHTPHKSSLHKGKGRAPKCDECGEEHFG